MTRTTDGPLVVGRYAIHGKIAAGGMATIHLGRLLGPIGFTKPVAIKRLHPDVARDPELVTMLVDEARIASCVRHANVVPILDVLTEGGEVCLVLEYVHGVSLARLLRAASEPPPPAVTIAIVCGVLLGLHAAHEALGKDGQPLNVIHRDVSPENVLVGDDGVARVIDFGIAKARGRLQSTAVGQVKGKPTYMAPEQWTGGELTRRADIYAAGVVLCEALTLERVQHLDPTTHDLVGPSAIPPSIPPALRRILVRALDVDPSGRFSTAREMALALEAALAPATPSIVAEWVNETARGMLDAHDQCIADFEATTMSTMRVVVPAGAELASEDTVGNRESKGRATYIVLPLLGLVAVGAYASSRNRHAVSHSDPVTVASAEASVAIPPAEVEAPAPLASSNRLPVAAPHTATKAVPRAHSNNCDPPYVLDGQGKRVYKRLCLR